jgi:hypothetical protein
MAISCGWLNNAAESVPSLYPATALPATVVTVKTFGVMVLLLFELLLQPKKSIGNANKKIDLFMGILLSWSNN